MVQLLLWQPLEPQYRPTAVESMSSHGGDMHSCDVRRDAGTLPGRCEHGTHATYQTRHSVACVECRVCALACARCSQPAGSVPASLDIVTSPRQLLSRSDQRDSTRATVSRAESSPKQPRLPPPALAEADRWRRARWRRRRSEGAGTSENALSFLSRFCVTYSHNEPPTPATVPATSTTAPAPRALLSIINGNQCLARPDSDTGRP